MKINAQMAERMDELRDFYAQAGGFLQILAWLWNFLSWRNSRAFCFHFGGPEDKNLVDGMQLKVEKRFMHHYNFPPYSPEKSGEQVLLIAEKLGTEHWQKKRLRWFYQQLENFPYTMRIVSESMASNGSTSQASICASTLALMDGWGSDQSSSCWNRDGLNVWESDEALSL